MLVLSRKKNQTIVIDSRIEIEVLQVKGNTVRIGVKAPDDVKILRGELQPVELQLTADSTESMLSNDQGQGRHLKVSEAQAAYAVQGQKLPLAGFVNSGAIPA